MIRSSWARTCSLVAWRATGSMCSARPSDDRRGEFGAAGSRSMQASRTVSTARSSAAAQVVASWPGCGVARSEMARSTSRRFHVELRSASSSSTSANRDRRCFDRSPLRLGVHGGDE